MKFYKIRAVIAIFLTKIIAKLFLVEMPPILSVGAIITNNKKMLFVDLSYQKGYGIPGGIVQAGETIIQALQREVLEETGLKVIDFKLFGSYPSKYKGISTLSIMFIAQVSGTLTGSKEGKVIWLGPDKVLDKLAYKDTTLAIKDYLKNVQQRL